MRFAIDLKKSYAVQFGASAPRIRKFWQQADLMTYAIYPADYAIDLAFGVAEMQGSRPVVKSRGLRLASR